MLGDSERRDGIVSGLTKIFCAPDGPSKSLFFSRGSLAILPPSAIWPPPLPNADPYSDQRDLLPQRHAQPGAHEDTRDEDQGNDDPENSRSSTFGSQRSMKIVASRGTVEGRLRPEQVVPGSGAEELQNGLTRKPEGTR